MVAPTLFKWCDCGDLCCTYAEQSEETGRLPCSTTATASHKAYEIFLRTPQRSPTIKVTKWPRRPPSYQQCNCEQFMTLRVSPLYHHRKLPATHRLGEKSQLTPQPCLLAVHGVQDVSIVTPQKPLSRRVEGDLVVQVWVLAIRYR